MNASNAMKFVNRLNNSERDRGGDVRAVLSCGKVVFTVQAPDRDAALKKICDAAFRVGQILDADDDGAVFSNGDGTFSAAMEIE